MENSFDLTPRQMQLASAMQELRICNQFSEKYGLALSESEIQELVSCRAKALQDTGRVEFGGGVLPKLVYAFCDSPFLDQENYEAILAELQDAFYYFKNESVDRISDDELIDYMVQVFNGRAQGSAEYLTGTSLEELCRYARDGWDPYNETEAGDLF
ncbi:MAG: DUF6323 family protein [Oscillospiraceae bacterium]|nr:DUF6323 family protein [Oscillospiraceae bacterium]